MYKKKYDRRIQYTEPAKNLSGSVSVILNSILSTPLSTIYRCDNNDGGQQQKESIKILELKLPRREIQIKREKEKHTQGEEGSFMMILFLD